MLIDAQVVPLSEYAPTPPLSPATATNLLDLQTVDDQYSVDGKLEVVQLIPLSEYAASALSPLTATNLFVFGLTAPAYQLPELSDPDEVQFFPFDE
jgi:hypothetical protein